ncbi:hypothetical protein PUN4_180159 [Paraburkholderia unamae]|nr:hypothetical protein PUN4_180159 [Paraburkholderia unamae]
MNECCVFRNRPLFLVMMFWGDALVVASIQVQVHSMYPLHFLAPRTPQSQPRMAHPMPEAARSAYTGRSARPACLALRCVEYRSRRNGCRGSCRLLEVGAF